MTHRAALARLCILLAMLPVLVSLVRVSQGQEVIRRLPPCGDSDFGPLQPEPVAVPVAEPVESCLLPHDFRDVHWDVNVLARSFYVNDQRWEFTGQEESFVVEGAVRPYVQRQYEDWQTTVLADLYINQRFDKNLLADTAERRSYLAHFEPEVLEISNLYLSAERNGWTVTMGKFETPFGRYYGRLLTNQRFDAPFIRTEAITWRETGILIQKQTRHLDAAAALVNGSEDRETNSSKGLVARVGLRGSNWAGGVSVKVHDGIGSESQKQFQRHVGGDLMVRRGKLRLSGEVIYDEYGFRRPGFDPLDITWERSLYLRDLNYRLNVPITAIGYYVDATYEGDRWYASLSYGGNNPQDLGHPIHDEEINRWVLKLVRKFGANSEVFLVTILESDGFRAQDNSDRMGEAVVGGFQATF